MYCTPSRSKMRLRLASLILLTAGVWSFADRGSLWAQPPSADKEAPAKEKEEEMKGVVEKIVDGDSIKVRENGGTEVHEIQIEGTDAPESKQDYGPESTEALRKMVLDRKVRITWTKKDNFGRRLAQVYVGEEHINRNMIRDGHAWHFKRYNQSKELAQLEEEARKAKRGLWGTENPQAPWDYRKENRTPDKPDR